MAEDEEEEAEERPDNGGIEPSILHRSPRISVNHTLELERRRRKGHTRGESRSGRR